MQPDKFTQKAQEALQAAQRLAPLSMKLLEGEFKPGERIKVGVKGGELVFARK